jgi:DnaJ-class molecular chaperone
MGTPISQAPPARLVGVPGEGERLCGKCRGAGLLNRRVASYPGWAICGACEGTGVVPESKGRSRAARNIITQGGARGAGR